MILKRAANSLATDLSDDATLYRVLGEKPDRPSHVSIGRVRACQSDQRALLLRAQLLIRLRTSVVGQSMCQSSLEVTPAHPTHFARVAANRIRDVAEVPTLVQQFEDASSPPEPSCRLTVAVIREFGTVAGLQL